MRKSQPCGSEVGRIKVAEAASGAAAPAGSKAAWSLGLPGFKQPPGGAEDKAFHLFARRSSKLLKDKKLTRR